MGLVLCLQRHALKGIDKGEEYVKECELTRRQNLWINSQPFEDRIGKPDAAT
jgi:hypothetical protein